jgi:AcrR family transcriptional regulator
MTDEFTTNISRIILELEHKGLVTRTFRRLDPGRQQAVIQAILAEAGEFGPQDLNIKRVGGRAGVSTGSLYQYFGNRENLLGFATELVTRVTVEAFNSYRPLLASMPLKEGLQAYIAGGEEWMEGQAGFALFFALAAYHGDPQMGEAIVRPIAAVLREMMQDLLAAAAQRGELRAGLDVEAAARVVNTVLIAVEDGVLLPYLNRYYQLTDDGFPIERIRAAALALILNGIWAKEPE